MYDYDIDTVDGIDTLRDRMADAGDSAEKWSRILSDYIQFGNNKIAKSVAIFNMNSASDCPNRESENCQVPWESCYAGKAERVYPQVLPYRRRQEYLWDCMTAEMWAEAFNALVDRKRNPVSAIRFSEAGDFRDDADIIKVNRIAELVDVDVYTYSASDYLDWSLADSFTVNQSNNFRDYGDRRFMAIDADADLPDGAVWCPFDYSDKSGDGRPKCGECRLCINPEGPDVAIPLH